MKANIPRVKLGKRFHLRPTSFAHTHLCSSGFGLSISSEQNLPSFPIEPWGGAKIRSHHAENPALNLGHLALSRLKLRAEELFETAIAVRPPQPFGCRIGILLVEISPCGRELLYIAKLK
jgi:hypothetical protein